MQSQITALALLLSFFWPIGPVEAASAPVHAECKVVGQVLSVSQRTEERDKSWADAWGLAHQVEYTDVTLAVISSALQTDEGINNCAEKTGEHSFQLRDDWQAWFTRLSPFDCVRGLSTLSGDEFLFGDWLYDLEQIDGSDCGDRGDPILRDLGIGDEPSSR